jgi:hypothetical protein
MNVQNNSNDILNGVSIVDTLNDLSNYHYLECNNNSSSDLKKYRGIIKNKDGTTICQTFGYTPEVDESNKDEMENIIKPFLGNGIVYSLPSYESTLLRVFYNLNDQEQGGWYVSTCRKIDAFTSRWGGSKSFGELFEECLNIELIQDQPKKAIERTNLQNWCNDNLDKNKVYCYIVRTYNENRIVCQGYDKPSLFLIASYDKDNNIDMSNCDVPTLNITTMEDLIERMKEVDATKSQGIILINEKGECVKIMKHEYIEGFKLRGNQPNILLRYIELQQEGDGERVEKFFNMYPDHKDTIITFTEVIEDICNFIFRKYRNRFIRKQVAIVPPDLYYIIRELHDGYLKDRTQIVTPERVMSYVHSLEPLKLLGLFNSYNKRKNEFGNGNKLSKEFMDKVKAMIM